jgi:predicted ABC-type ATPase
VNADEIGARLRAAAPSAGRESPDLDRQAFEKAGELREALLAAGQSFGTETVFSDTEGHKLDFLRRARAAGYVVFLVFIGLTDAQLSRARVVQRVEAGGHDVPDEKLDARFPRTLANLRSAIQEVDEAFIVDNSDADLEPYRPVAIYLGGRLDWRSDRMPVWANGLPGLE